jgi:hypothetical protein
MSFGKFAVHEQIVLAFIMEFELGSRVIEGLTLENNTGAWWREDSIRRRVDQAYVNDNSPVS